MDYNNDNNDTGEVREPVVVYGKSKFTIEEYLEMERAGNWKHEYYQGEIFAADLASFTKGRPGQPLGISPRVHAPPFPGPHPSIPWPGNCIPS